MCNSKFISDDFRSLLHKSTLLLLSNHDFSDHIGSISDYDKIKEIEEQISIFIMERRMNLFQG
jgi:hypothetical protein